MSLCRVAARCGWSHDDACTGLSDERVHAEWDDVRTRLLGFGVTNEDPEGGNRDGEWAAEGE
jgi:hypothetical protein